MGYIADSPKTWKQVNQTMPEPEVTEAEVLQMLEERLCDDYDMGYRLRNLRGGCTCFISAPCNACSSPLTIEEAESLGWV